MGLSSSIPGAMKFVRGSPVALAAEQRAIVGELTARQYSGKLKRADQLGIGTYLLDMTSVK